MKKVIGLVLAAASFGAFAQFYTHTYIVNNRVVTCTTTCVNGQNCTTSCF